MTPLEHAIINALGDLKGRDITEIDVRPWSDQFQTFIIVTATSSRHAMAISDHLSETLKHDPVFGRPVRVQKDGEAHWILMDFEIVIVHIMQQEARDFYNLEKLWMNPNAGPTVRL